MYARKDCTDQLRKLHKISIDPPQTQVVNDAFVVTVTARTKDGRTDTEIGADSIKGLTGDSLCNAILEVNHQGETPRHLEYLWVGPIG